MSAPSAPVLLNRRALLTALGVGTAGVLAACASGTGSQSQTATASASAGGLVIGMTYTPNVQFAPFYLAAADGQYAEGVSLRHHGEQEGQFDALLAGTEHIVVAGGDEAIVAASNGNALVVIGGYYQRYPGCIIVPEDSDITDLASLAGKSIGTPGKTGETWYSVLVALSSAGLTEDDVDVQEIGYTQQAALASGKVDAIAGFSNNDAVQIAQNGMPVRIITIGDHVPLLGASLVTTPEVLAQRRAELEAAVMASAAGMTTFVDDPDAAVEATKEYVPDLVDQTQADHAREVAVATGELVRPSEDTVIGSLVPEQVGETIDFLAGRGLLGETTVTSDDVCDPLLTA
ncbi:ABC transporter substrate-binding protein [Actinomyces sp. MRS3W]|uniref:ABC transporter substrate-binding protein n=1 Tax=Actinomyces sp. MRS3W TaxID=2800796 RepID=UPI0028FD0C02|nr:ABC transporter substrate-binding protein [Actinomyces sp. MRS3W]MDU0347443.1 ABC transporter substrate-binding protein [Actinomyces sp. MRS3W]